MVLPVQGVALIAVIVFMLEQVEVEQVDEHMNT